MSLSDQIHQLKPPSRVLFSGVPDDDIIAFALSARSAGIPMHICNENKFGYIMTPLEDGQDLADDRWRLSDLRLQVRILSMLIYALHVSTLVHFITYN